MKKKNFLVLPLLFAGGITFSQTADSVSAVSQNPPSVSVVDTTQAGNNFLELSLDDLMNTPIVSASKEKESSFDAPITSCVITRQEIINMGSTSIPDALRLCPAILVREVANGAYDVSIRGGIDNVASYQYQNVNTTILAMIDNRPVFSNFQGGTFWSNLPVDLSDVERIEVVYGPNAPMYGPNAVSGVVNIITRKEYGQKNTVAHANIQYGRNSLYSAYIGHKISDKIEINASANQSSKLRDVVEFYNSATDSYTDDIKKVSVTPDQTYSLQKESLKKTAMNFNLNFTPNKKVFVNFNSSYNNNQTWGSLQATTSQNVLTNTSNSHMVKAEAYNFSAQASLLSGTQGLIGNDRNFFHDYVTQDLYLDYNLKLFDKKLSIRPAIAHQIASVDDRKYTVDVNKQGLFNNSGAIENLSGSLKLDYKPIKLIRIIAAGRLDKFSAPDKVYPSFQFAVNVKPSDNHIFRAAYGRSYSGSFITPTYANFVAFNGIIGATNTELGPPFGTVTTLQNYKLTIQGSNTRKLLRNDMIELGYKGQFGKNLQVDVSLFTQKFQDMSLFVNQKSTVTLDPNPSLPPFIPIPGKVNISQNSVVSNLNTVVYQNGVSFAVNFVTNDKIFSLKPHFTIQETRISNYVIYYFDKGANDVNPGLDVANSKNVYSKGTPNWFGGFSMNLNPIKRLNIGLSAYYYDKTYMTTIAGQSSLGGGVTKSTINDNVNEKGILNANISYKVHDNIAVGFNARNVLNNDTRESWGSDRLGANYYGTLVIEY